ncbi:MAG: TAXI family TRAP transporter solute-binding subunit [Pseudomonadota bacterium]
MKHLATSLLAVAALATGPAVAQVNLTAETASPGGVAHLSTISLAEAAAAEGVANIQVSDGQTLTNTIVNVAEGNTDISAAPFILPFLLSRGVGPYAAQGPEQGAELADNLAVLYTYNLGVFTLYAFDSSPVKGWDTIEGQRIYNGPPRGGALNNARAIIKIITGLDDGDGYEGVQVNWGQAVPTITGGAADAMVLPTNFPDGRMSRSLGSGNMTIWSMPSEAFESEASQNYAQVPGSAAFAMPIADLNFGDGVTVVSEDEMFRGLATIGGEIVNVDMDFDTAKALTAAFIARLDETRQRTPFAAAAQFGDTDPAATGMCGRNPLKYHPGAVAAWEEAGFTIPDCAK